MEFLKTQVGLVQGHVIYCKGNSATNLSIGIANGDYCLIHAEADTMLSSACAKPRTRNCTGTVAIVCTDSDVYVQAAYVSHSLRGDLMIKHKNALVDWLAMLPDEVTNIIIPLHVMSESDHIPGFCEHGKKLLMKVADDPEANELLGQVGESLEFDAEVED